MGYFFASEYSIKMSLFFLLTEIVLVSSSQIGVLVSDATPFACEDLLCLLSDPTDIALLPAGNSPEEEEALLTSPLPEVVLDYSYSQKLSARLSEARRDVVVIGMYEDCPAQLLQGKLTAMETALGVANHLQALNFTRVFLAVSATPFYLQLARDLHSFSLSFAQEVYLHPKLTETEVLQFVGRMLKPAGSLVAVLLVDEETGALVLSALRAFHIYKQGYAYVFSMEASWNERSEGMLYVSDSVAVGARDRIHYEALILADTLKYVRSQGIYARPKSLALVNIRESIDIVVTRDTVLGFPGNASAISLLTKPIIQVSADLIALNWDGTISPLSDRVSRGTIVGYREANRRTDIMTNFQFELSEVNLGGAKFNKSWALSQFQKHESRIGVAFNGFGFGASTIGINNLFVELGKYIPNTSASPSSTLSNTTQFPLFLRTSSNSASYVLVMVRFFRLFGWKRAAVIYSDSQGDLDNWKWFRTYGEQFGIDVTNDESKRKLPIDLVNSQQQLNDTVSDILNSTVRVVIIWHSQAERIAERMYDFGARAGDYVICQTYGLSYTYFITDPLSAHKRKAIFKGSLMFYDRYFSGTEGPRVKQLLRAIDGENYHPFSCVYYDSSMLVAHAVSFMLAKGMHYEDGRALIAEMRQTRFNGCTGIIQFESGLNDRRPRDFSVANMHITGENETVEIVDAALYSPTKVQLFTFFPSFQFPDERLKTFPDSWVEDEKCPYIAKTIRELWKGRRVGLAFSIMAMTVTACASIFTWLKLRHFSGEMLIEPTLISLEDALILLSLLIEFIQLLALGPDMKLHDSIRRIEGLSLLGIEELVSAPQGVFGRVVLLVIGLVGLECAILILEMFAKSRQWSCGLCSTCEYWWTLLLLYFLRVSFVPGTYTLLSMFQCSRAYGDNLTDSFLDRDCHQTCWNDWHLAIAVLAGICLCIYLILNNFIQQLWQEVQVNLHVKASPSYIAIRSVMLMILVSNKVFFKAINILAHAYLYVCTAFTYMLCLLLIKPWNYARMNLWTRLMQCAVLASASVSLCTLQVASFSILPAFITLSLCFALLLVTGLCLQFFLPKYRAMLVRLKDDRYDIIKFAFTFGALAQKHLQNFKSKHPGEHYSVPTTNNEDAQRIS